MFASVFQMKKRLLIVFFIVLMLGSVLFVLYWQLGGLRDPSVALQQVRPFKIVGKSYKGYLGSPRLNQLMEETEAAYRNGLLPGVFTICFFGNPQVQDTLKVLVGVTLEEGARVPEGYESYTADGGPMVVAEMTSHVLVAPSTATTDQLIQGFAEAQNLELKAIQFEQYLSEQQVLTLVPVAEAAGAE